MYDGKCIYWCVAIQIPLQYQRVHLKTLICFLSNLYLFIYNSNTSNINSRCVYGLPSVTTYICCIIMKPIIWFSIHWNCHIYLICTKTFILNIIILNRNWIEIKNVTNCTKTKKLKKQKLKSTEIIFPSRYHGEPPYIR